MNTITCFWTVLDSHIVEYHLLLLDQHWIHTVFVNTISCCLSNIGFTQFLWVPSPAVWAILLDYCESNNIAVCEYYLLLFEQHWIHTLFVNTSTDSRTSSPLFFLAIIWFFLLLRGALFFLLKPDVCVPPSPLSVLPPPPPFCRCCRPSPIDVVAPSPRLYCPPPLLSVLK